MTDVRGCTYLNELTDAIMATLTVKSRMIVWISDLYVVHRYL